MCPKRLPGLDRGKPATRTNISRARARRDSRSPFAVWPKMIEIRACALHALQAFDAQRIEEPTARPLTPVTQSKTFLAEAAADAARALL
jgi:hypothetical protein